MRRAVHQGNDFRHIEFRKGRCVAVGVAGGVAGGGFASVSFVTGSSEVVLMRGRR